MAACTLALSPSSAKVDVCKRRTLRLSSGSPTSTPHRSGARQVGIGRAQGELGKGPNGKVGWYWGNSIWKLVPCARYTCYMAPFGGKCKEARGQPRKMSRDRDLLQLGA